MIAAPMPSGVEHQTYEGEELQATIVIAAPMPSGVEHLLVELHVLDPLPQ